MANSASTQIGHLLFELDQLHAKVLASGLEGVKIATEFNHLERQIQDLCSQQDHARLLRMSRAYRALTASRSR